MMKLGLLTKTLISVLLIQLSCSAHALFPGFYPKIAAHRMQLNLSNQEGFLLDSTLPAIQFSLSYHPSQSWGLEVAYHQILSTADLSELFSKGSLDLRYKSIFPLSRKLEFYIPVGATRIESKGNLYWAPQWGLGGRCSITENILIEFNWISTYFLKIPFFESLNYPFSGNIESYSIGVVFYLG